MEAFMVVVRAWIILARSAVDGSAMGDDVEVAEVVGDAGLASGVEVEEDRWLADTRLSRAWASREGGPWLLNW
jgi:hypothetical protein